MLSEFCGGNVSNTNEVYKEQAMLALLIRPK